ncbi:MAG: phytoene/squalene synthase family protein [Ignavibacteria bacterium]|nr:phytoene/squalene synthase family protein [Ignavibacteria bacterium]
MTFEEQNMNNDFLNIMKKSRTNFFYSSVFLPKPKREALRIVYAYCRITDDIADDTSVPADIKRRNLNEWKNKLDKALKNESTDKFFIELKKQIDTFNIPHKPFYDLIRGMEMDLDKKRFETFEDLYEYCYCAASSVGLMTIEIFGYENPEIKRFAEYLGVALQLTNIMRDVKKDYEEERIYLPLEDMREFDYTEEDLKNFIYNKNFRKLMKYEYERAVYFYSQADSFLTKKDKGRMLPARIMEHIYFDLLGHIKKRDYNIFEKKISVPKLKKLLWAYGVFIKYKLLYNK